MHRSYRPPRPGRRVLRLVMLLAATLALGACDHDIDITAPRIPDPTPGPDNRTLEISVNLTALDGSCVEATLLWDGVELPGAHRSCAEGCTRLDLTASTPRSEGVHTLEVQVLRQSPAAVDYMVAGDVVIAGGPRLGFSMPLGPTHQTLRVGESVSYQLEFDIDLWP